VCAESQKKKVQRKLKWPTSFFNQENHFEQTIGKGDMDRATRKPHTSSLLDWKLIFDIMGGEQDREEEPGGGSTQSLKIGEGGAANKGVKRQRLGRGKSW